jgi:tripeptide aminopeptidase
MPDVLDRFLRYVRIDTQSDPDSNSSPTTAGQFDLAHLLVKELKEIGLQDAAVNADCIVTATLPTNLEGDWPAIGLIAHMDTSPETSGADVNPQIVERYDGSDILLDAENDIVLSADDFPELRSYIGQTLITTDGKTLLGADDKAGVAEIMAALAYLAAHPEIKRPSVRVAFTPDEEVGRGVDHFDVEAFGVEYAFTIDGGEIGELVYENFNASRARVTVKGRVVHPGTAKNKMKNAAHIAIELVNMLPPQERPEHTEHYEGFFHLMKFQAEVEAAALEFIIRDHDRSKFEAKKQLLLDAAAYLNRRNGEGSVKVELVDQYYNMKEHILPVKHILEVARQAMLAAGVEPLIRPIRGGTDGARLSEMGLPTPNLFSGGHNYHGRHEYIPLPSMEKAVEVIVRLVGLLAG